ncbi:hypothetical protein [Vitiosangium sp. GDMCC 1.1324]|uniref:hypothetical protein n=1 Tax=Vitiosangium sp. (strain GDMCC 1.1324) TaxID=2138576 RepID=UPI000D362370|nr:hypothetical protein [Vitiosangium sp. GDMCC 1.1324]PTL78110.1 hypothetical protein DAT35_41590 [Vitiosangium sp. GDMCC 1.1324]
MAAKSKRPAKKSAKKQRTAAPARNTRKPAARKKQPAAPRRQTALAQAEHSVDQWVEMWPKLVARAWSDEQFMTRLVREPDQVARELNLPVFRNFHIDVSVGTQPPTLVLNIPPKPSDLTDPENVAKDAVERKTCSNTCTY